MTQNVSDTLNLAADLIEERGWVKGSIGFHAEGTGPLCLEGGIFAALGLSWSAGSANTVAQKGTCPAYEAVRAYLEIDPIIPDYRDASRLYNWNDRVAKSGEEVVEVLRATALIESAREREAAEVSA